MKTKEQKNEFMPYSIFATILTAISLTSTFLSGKIIFIPNGTYEGGVISVIGVGVILLAMVAVIIVITLLRRKKAM